MKAREIRLRHRQRGQRSRLTYVTIKGRSMHSVFRVLRVACFPRLEMETVKGWKVCALETSPVYRPRKERR